MPTAEAAGPGSQPGQIDTTFHGCYDAERWGYVLQAPCRKAARLAGVGPARTTKSEAKMEFYNVRTRAKVTVPDNQVKKQKLERTTSKGNRQTRYAAVAEADGTRLMRFIDEKTYQSLNVPEVG